MEEHSANFNHDGGQLAFGPDGYLYMTIGDGGSGYDPDRNGQKLSTLLGKMLRIDVNATTGNLPYGIPADNPFVGQAGVREEIWHYGLRNAWRYHHDTVSGNLFIADVGQDVTEEVDVAPIGQGGLNFGWSCREGTDELNSDTCPADRSTLVDPIFTYEQVGGRCSVTGGYVYNGCNVPELRGRYIFSDYCSSEILSFLYAGGQATEQTVHDNLSLTGGVSSFGLDGAGELYVITYGDGTIWRFDPQ